MNALTKKSMLVFILLSCVTSLAFADDASASDAAASKLRKQQEVLFAQALLANPDTQINCADAGDGRQIMTYADLTKAAIGDKTALEWVFRASDQSVLVDRIHRANDGLFAGVGDAIGNALTLGLEMNQTFLILIAGKQEVSADFKAGTTQMLEISCMPTPTDN